MSCGGNLHFNSVVAGEQQKYCFSFHGFASICFQYVHKFTLHWWMIPWRNVLSWEKEVGQRSHWVEGSSFHYNITATASSSILNGWEYVIFKWKANIDSLPYALPMLDTLRWVCCSASWRKWIFAKPLVTVVCRIKNGDEDMKRSAQRFLYSRVLCAMRKCYYNFLLNIGCEKVIYSHNGFSLRIGCRNKRTICWGKN